MNGGTLHTRGIEVGLKAKWASGLEAALSHSIQDSRDVSTGDVLTNSPKQILKANLSLPVVRQGYFASVEAQYVSERRTLVGTDLGGFLLVNATLLTSKLRKDLDISVSLYNLFDRRYAETGGLEHVQASIPQDGRSFRVKLVYRPHFGRR